MEIYNVGGLGLEQKITELFQSMRSQGFFSLPVPGYKRMRPLSAEISATEVNRLAISKQHVSALNSWETRRQRVGVTSDSDHHKQI